MQSEPTVTPSCWSSSLLLTAVSITSAQRQSNALRKMTTETDGFVKLRQLLARWRRETPVEEEDDDSNTARLNESRASYFAFQTPIMLLKKAIELHVVGLLALIFEDAMAAMSRNSTTVWKTAKVSRRFAAAD